MPPVPPVPQPPVVPEPQQPPAQPVAQQQFSPPQSFAPAQPTFAPATQQQFPPTAQHVAQQPAQQTYVPQAPPQSGLPTQQFAPTQQQFAPAQQQYGNAPAYGAPAAPGYGLPPTPNFTAPHINQQPSGMTADALRAPLQARSAAPGKIALIFGVLAGIVAPLLAIGTSVPLGLALKDFVASSGWPESLHWLRPVATWELVTELTVYAGILFGVLAIVFAIVAISQQRGQRQGKIALILTGIGIVLMLGGVAAAVLLPQAIR